MQYHDSALAKSFNYPQPSMVLMHRLFLTFMVASMVFLLLVKPALAGANSPMGNALCAIVYIIYGNLGRGLATLAVIIVGIGALLGKTSWGLALTVATGIAVIFNAGDIVVALGVGGGGC